MPGKPSNPKQFWHELKRRKVVRVITVYAAAAWVILEFISNIEEPFGLPDWTTRLVFVILCVGLIVSIMLSWIYDISPEGIEKTKPAQETIEVIPEKQSTVNAWKIATLISVIIIIGLIIFNIFGRIGKVEDLAVLDKSIAVLPFKSLSDDPEKQYLADGVMDAILLHLSKIEDLRVMARTSVEQYRVTDKTASAICQELDVAYLLEGSFQKYGEQARLILQLIEPGKEGHIWANEYDRNWTDIFSVQSEVAQAIAKELQAVITPEEKQLIEKVPTSNLTAYDFYLRGTEAHLTFLLDRTNTGTLDRAEDLYKKALHHDSLFAEAYTALAFVNIHRYQINETKDYQDSILILADIALSYDDQSSWAYDARGWYYLTKNQFDRAIEEFDKTLLYDPNSPGGYEGKGWIYWLNKDYVGAIDNFEKIISLDRGRLLPQRLRSLGNLYCYAGFLTKAQYYYEQAVKLTEDSITYFIDLASSEYHYGHYSKAIEILQKGYLKDSLHTDVLIRLVNSYMLNGQIEKSIEYTEKYIERKLALEQFTPSNTNTVVVGYYYWQKGYHEEAEYYFTEGIKKWEEIIRTGDTFLMDDAYIQLAAIHAFRGEENQACEYLRLLNQQPRMPIQYSTFLRNFPLFNSIQNKPEFQQILFDVEAKYLTEHERVRKWLEENDML